MRLNENAFFFSGKEQTCGRLWSLKLKILRCLWSTVTPRSDVVLCTVLLHNCIHAEGCKPCANRGQVCALKIIHWCQSSKLLQALASNFGPMTIFLSYLYFYMFCNGASSSTRGESDCYLSISHLPSLTRPWCTPFVLVIYSFGMGRIERTSSYPLHIYRSLPSSVHLFWLCNCGLQALSVLWHRHPMLDIGHW
jgi:hypothetical protein